MGCSASKGPRSPSHSPEATPAKKQRMKEASVEPQQQGLTTESKNLTPKSTYAPKEEAKEHHAEQEKSEITNLTEPTPKSTPAPAHVVTEVTHRPSPARNVQQETSPKTTPALPVTEQNHKASMPRSEPKEPTPKSTPAPAHVVTEAAHRPSPARNVQQETSPKTTPALPVTEQNHKASMPRSEPKEPSPKPVRVRTYLTAQPHHSESTRAAEHATDVGATHSHSGTSPPLRRSPYAGRRTADSQLLRAARVTQARKSASPEVQREPVAHTPQTASGKNGAFPATQVNKSPLSEPTALRGARSGNEAALKEEAPTRSSNRHVAPKFVTREDKLSTESKTADQNARPGTHSLTHISSAVKTDKHDTQPRREAMHTVQSNIVHPVTSLHLRLDYTKNSAAPAAVTEQKGSSNGTFVSTSVEKRLRTEPEQTREVQAPPVTPESMVVENVKNNWVVVRSVPSADGWQLLRQIRTLMHLVGTVPT